MKEATSEDLSQHDALHESSSAEKAKSKPVRVTQEIAEALEMLVASESVVAPEVSAHACSSAFGRFLTAVVVVLCIHCSERSLSS